MDTSIRVVLLILLVLPVWQISEFLNGSLPLKESPPLTRVQPVYPFSPGIILLKNSLVILSIRIHLQILLGPALPTKPDQIIFHPDSLLYGCLLGHKEW